VPSIQRGLAAVTAAVVACLAWRGWWPFAASPAGINSFEKPTAWQYLFSDRYVLGIVRLGAAAFALYLVISIPPLVVAARWAKGFGTSGIAADDAARASRTLEDYEETVADLTNKLDAANETLSRVSQQRDSAIRLLTGLTSTTTSTARTTATIGEEDIADDDLGDQPAAGGTDK
jgi:hypothetical protein